MRPALLLAGLALALGGCVRESEGDRVILEDESRYRGDAFRGGEAEPDEPDPFDVFAGSLLEVFTYPRLHPADGPFTVEIDPAKREVRLERQDGSAVLALEIPADFEFLDDPGPITFHRDGRVTWPKADRTLLHPEATACDITVRHRTSGWICAYDLSPVDGGLELSMRATEPKKRR